MIGPARAPKLYSTQSGKDQNSSSDSILPTFVLPQHGTAAAGLSQCASSPEICTSCEIGYTLQTDTHACKENVCTCPNGTPDSGTPGRHILLAEQASESRLREIYTRPGATFAVHDDGPLRCTGRACGADGTISCETCAVGFVKMLKGQQCVPVSCSCSNGRAVRQRHHRCRCSAWFCFFTTVCESNRVQLELTPIVSFAPKVSYHTQDLRELGHQHGLEEVANTMSDLQTVLRNCPGPGAEVRTKPYTAHRSSY